MASLWDHYTVNGTYDEMRSPANQARPSSHRLSSYLDSLGHDALDIRKSAADMAIMEMGITFTVYSDEGNIDRAWPFDIIPRIIENKEWLRVETGLKQRLKALNCFINDTYNEQRFIKEGLIPANIITSSSNFLQECVGVQPKFGAWANICGSDLVRDKDGTLYVLEDNLRVPSGVSYMIENRVITKKVFPELLQDLDVLPVDDYPAHLLCPLRRNRATIPG
jgi:uncharacterized circularly permuted ATP-grasp superfamily protein